MGANVPVSRPISWKAIPIVVTVWIAFMCIFVWIYPSNGIFIGMIVFGLLFFTLQRVVPNSHNKGMRAVLKNDFNTAIAHFQKSASFFSKNNWVDKYRAITILSISSLSYREIALCNIAFCYSHTNQPKKAKELYEKILLEYPNNGIAYYSLNAIQTFSGGQTDF